MQISYFVNPFGGSRKKAHKNVGQFAAQMFYKGPLMIDDLLRTSPKEVI